MKTIKTKAYEIEELSEEARAKALDSMRSINVEYWDWWHFLEDQFTEELAKIGLATNGKPYFDLDRADYIYFEDLSIESEAKLLKAAGVDLRSKEAKSIIENGLEADLQHYGGGSARNYVVISYHADGDEKKLSDVQANITELLNSTLGEFKRQLRDEYEWATSDEAVLDTVRSNEYLFTEDGTREVYL